MIGVSSLLNRIQWLVQIEERAVQTVQVSTREKSKEKKKLKQESGPEPTGKSSVDAFATQVTKQQSVQSNGKWPCAFCERSDHPYWKCTIYGTVASRKIKVKELKLCFICLRSSHSARECKAKKKSCYHCQGAHNSSICNKKDESNSEPAKIVAATEAEQAVHTTTAMMLTKVWAENCGVSVRRRRQVAILIDTGSQLTLVTSELADKLKLKVIKKETLTIAQFMVRNRSHRKKSNCRLYLPEECESNW